MPHKNLNDKKKTNKITVKEEKKICVRGDPLPTWWGLEYVVSPEEE